MFLYCLYWMIVWDDLFPFLKIRKNIILIFHVGIAIFDYRYIISKKDKKFQQQYDYDIASVMKDWPIFENNMIT